ncbi:MAG: hypothetical protein PUP91_03805 [Rhizonema sp. PD37]|nr:hypothetical protein [Rhizonema sp. PD37]
MNKLVALKARIQFLCALGLAASSTVWLPQPTKALCAASPMDATWQNIDSNTRSIVKVEYRTNCNDVVLCPVGEPCSQSAQDVGKIRIFGSCHPSACDWGWTPVYKKSQWVKGLYSQGFAQRQVWAKLQNNQLVLVIRSHFTDNSGRADYETREYFRKLGK